MRLFYSYCFLICLIKTTSAAYDVRKLLHLGPKESVPPKTDAGCKIDIEEMSRKYEPLLVRTNKDGKKEIALPTFEKKLIFATKKVINLKTDEEIILVCLGKDNLLYSSKEQVNKAQCHVEDYLSVKDEVLKFSNLHCKFPVEGSSKKTGEKCGDGDKGELIQVGFEVEGEFIESYKSCHNIEKANTLYSRHDITGLYMPNMPRLMPDNAKFLQDIDELYKDIDLEKAYQKRRQEEVMVRGIGLWESVRLIGRSKKHYWVPTQLSPPNDFYYDNEHWNTNFYVNAAPQWPTIKIGNWFNLEEAIRNYAKKYEKKLTIVTGTHGSLDLVDVGGRAGMALEDDEDPEKRKINVPKHFWKLVVDPDLKACIGFIITNDPFKIQKPKPLCEDLCRVFRWKPYQSDFKKGYVYCCEYKEMKDEVKDMPTFECDRPLIGK